MEIEEFIFVDIFVREFVCFFCRCF